MADIRDLMARLDGADAETVNRIAWKEGSLPVRLAMLGLASQRIQERPLWWGYPPGVFISYKWNGAPMRELVTELAAYVRSRGYRAYPDIENLDENADAYFQIPQFIVSLQECTFYLLLLTGLSADWMTGRRHRTSWIHEEYQHALRLANSGRLIVVPVLLEPEGVTEDHPRASVIDLTATPRDFRALDAVLWPEPLVLDPARTEELKAAVAQFDTLFLNQRWDESAGVLQRVPHLAATFDHQLRTMLHALYTGNGPDFERALGQLREGYGDQPVAHLYQGYCGRHGIPVRFTLP